MRQRSTSTSAARLFAVAALVLGFLVLAIVVATSLGEREEGAPRPEQPSGQVAPQGERRGEGPAAYVVQNGDTLTSIARKTGVSVQRLQQLNPDVDPQILVSGERLKLR